MRTISEEVSRVAGEVARQTEAKILQSLNDLIKRDLIRVELGPMVLVNEHMSDKVEMRQEVVLKLKDQEYIETLERENLGLRSVISTMKKVSAIRTNVFDRK